MAVKGSIRPVSVLLLAVLLFAVSALILVSGCGEEKVTVEDDSGEKNVTRSLEASVGEEIVVTLEANPSTGYSWRLTEPLDEKVITLERTSFQQDDVKSGAPGTRVWWFRAVGEGKAEIDMEYVRTWEKDKEPARTFTAAVTVSGEDGAKAMEYSDPDSPIEVGKGDTFYIVLDSNPTTGYQWELAGPFDDKVLSLEGSRYEAPQDTTVMGAGGKEYWEFDAVGSGSTEVSFRYVRSWEKDVEPTSSAAFTVNVK